MLAGVLALVAGAPATPATAAGETGDGPGTYFLFRTYPTAGRPLPEHVRACDDHFGARASTVFLRQEAPEYVPLVDQSGLAVSEDATHVGAGYVCVAPGANQDLNDAFAIAELPAGHVELTGSCAAQVAEIIRLAPFAACRFATGPVPTAGSPGGYAVGTSIAGSIFMGYLVRDPAQPLPYTPPAPDPGHTTLPNDPDFYLWRAFDQANPATWPDCTQAGVALPSAVRTASLSATQADPRTAALDPAEPLTKTGSLTVCFAGSTGATHPASALIRLSRAGTTVTAIAPGECRDAPMPTRSDLLIQTCALSLQYAGSTLFRAGQLTSIGLVHTNAPAVAANIHVWTLAILDGNTEGGGG